jgi:hypothetical protein
MNLNELFCVFMSCLYLSNESCFKAYSFEIAILKINEIFWLLFQVL